MGLSTIRGKIRQFARQENGIGFACSFALSLFRKGWNRTAAMIPEHRSAQISVRDLPELKLTKEEKETQQKTAFTRRLVFSILVPLYNTPEDLLREMIGSVQGQTYPDWELCLADGSDPEHGYVETVCREYAEQDGRILYRKLPENKGIAENTNACLDMATGDYLALLDHDDLLTPSALFENRKAIEEQGADFLYSDEAVFASPDPDRLILAHLKPDFAPDDLLSNNYICHLTVFKRDLLATAGRFRGEYDGSQDYDMILRLTDRAERIVHIPKVLYLWRSHADSAASGTAAKPYTAEAGRKAVRDFLAERRGVSAEVTDAPIAPCMYRVSYPIEEMPLVSVVLNADPAEEADQQWLEKLKENTAYTNIEWLFALPRQEKESARLNKTVQRAEGEYLLFLDQGLTPDAPDWIENLLMYAQRQNTGAVGARVVFDNGLVRHAGIVPGFGKSRTAGRRFFRYPAESGADMGRLGIAGNVSAVSSECMMIRRGAFEEAGGFEEAYAHSLHDVDLCLKLRAKGYLVVYTPWPEMKGGRMPGKNRVEYGSGKPGYRQDAALFRENWKETLNKGDPYYHPKFSKDRMIFRPLCENPDL